MPKRTWSALTSPASRRQTKRCPDLRLTGTSKHQTGVQHRTRITNRYSTDKSLSPADADLKKYEDDLDQLEDHTILAVDRVSNGKMGCAHYIARHQLLSCMQDVDNGGAELTEQLCMEIEPTVILLSSRAENHASHADMKRQSSLVNADNDSASLPWEIVVRPVSDFKYENAVLKLSALDIVTTTDYIRFVVPGDNMDYNEQQNVDEIGLVEKSGKLLSIAGSLEVENTTSIGCAGAIIGYLQRRRASEYLENDPAGDAAYQITRIEMFGLKSTMLLSSDTLSSLQILQTETHPNIANQGPHASGAKESLSVYGLFQRFTRSPQGKLRLRQMFLKPTLDLREIAERQDFIATFVRAENQPHCDLLSKSLRRIKDMKVIMTSLRKGIQRGTQNSGTIRSGVWAAILDFCYHCIDIRDNLKEVTSAQDLGVIALADDILDKAQMIGIGKLVHDTVDLDESLEQQRTVVKRGIDNALDAVKNAYDGIEEVLKRVAFEITNSMPEHVEASLNVVYLPQLGFHVTVPLDEKTQDPIWSGDESWQKRFSTDNYQYFKNDKMREMDLHCGDLHALICDTEIEISHNLAQRVLEHEEWLLKASGFCGELDSLLALAHGALQYKLTRPKCVEDNIINIKGGRHILQETLVGSYVANDVLLASGGNQDCEVERPSMILLTGPNFSGKSVFMKQVALIVYMAHVGSFVPADFACIGMTDKILTRINTAETVSKMQSAFLIDLQQISRMLKACTNRSLVIIDEFGKGTDSCDGAGLAAGVFKYLLDLEAEAPKTLASTHFHEVFEHGEFDQYRNLAQVHMAVHVRSDEAPGHPLDKEITYLYNLCKGRSTLSYGTQCAIANGIPKNVVDRAKSLVDLSTCGDDLVITCAKLPPSEMEELERAEELCREFLAEGFLDEL